MILYPALDVLDGRAVRLSRGDFAKKKVYSEDPAAVLESFQKSGAKVAHVVDLSGAREPAKRQKDLFKKLLAATGLKVQAGGGIRAREDALELLDWGAERVVLGSVAVTDPALGEALIAELGPQRVTLAVDVTIEDDGAARAHIKGWAEKTALSIEELIRRLRPWGLTRLLCTDISRDGAAEGPNADLYVRLVNEFPGLEVQASGGVRGLHDLQTLGAAGVHSAVVGTALYEGRLDLAEALQKC